MAIGPRLDLRQTQSLVMTPQLRQAIKLLQFSNMEVAGFIEEELERNPLLERDERPDLPDVERAAIDQRPVANGVADAADHVRGETLPTAAETPLDFDHAETYDAGGVADGAPDGGMGGSLGGGMDGGRGGRADFATDDRGIEDLVESPRNLRDHLGEQLRLSFGDAADRLIGAHLIALLDPAGRLTAAPEAIARTMGVDLDRVEAVRARMMRFDPVGLFARDLRECLAAQLAEKNRLDPAMAALLDNLDLLARREMRRLMTVCGVDAEDMAEMVAEVRALDPKPAAAWDHAPAVALIPDVLMRATPDGGWMLELNPATMPRVLVNQSFYAKVVPRADRQERSFLAERLQTANWLVKSLQQRAQTILKVAAEIVRQQDGFFRHGVAHLRPLILRDIADAVEMHESTVSRVTANKYIATQRGTFELKYFFTTAIAGTSGETHSAEAVRHRIRALVSAETADDILSDDAIVAALKREGVDIARRTVAKYREALRIPSSVQRKREKAVPA
ncbi:RNA polymerase factor sigma-54 [Acidisphaera rubrifaciens]|uniref:RNA polymerase sigma-54 factor n=1 Tax=Acidisphaera rubrifaciens HS-AP3 TaxID=1231350 RepID=A0A0D6P411_9PROT|nr:RNA polymerase factor sigma-54 [Acidisphaera rubrifaciens]GAN76397.1 DNA-directed RNA polymerase sigma-54 factor RpoN [Acidisphaera rubrifaciens HS-AP3]